MKREDILNMQAGTEMDELITVHVFDEPVPPHGFSVEKYSTDISAAWEVVEKCIEKNIYMRIAYQEKDDEAERYYGDESGWWIEYFIKGKDDGDVVMSCETAPLAICRTAIVAVMGLE